jgi:hypothetical protein
MKKFKKSELLDELTDKEYLVSDPENDLVVFFDNEAQKDHGLHKITRLFRIVEGEMAEELVMKDVVKELVTALKDRIDVQEYLTEVLLTTAPPEVLKAYEIIHKYPEAAKTAKTRPGCVYLDIVDPRPGKDSVPIYLRF